MRYFLSLVFTGWTILACAQQKYKLSGKVSSADGEELIQATVVATQNGVSSGTVTDIAGNYTLQLLPGTYQVKVSFVGLLSEEKTVTIGNASQVLDFKLKRDEAIVDEVVVTADIAKPRETPVAYTNINQRKLAEELGSRDLPMVLNTTPGVYATQQGGGAGDARVTIRGFNQRNIAVMVDGIPVNDMENGQVYWSNWFGLSEVTRTMQVQRGLGVSKIANPAVGGTINIMTRGIDAKRSMVFGTETGNNGYFKATFAGTTGRLKHDWGLTYAFTYRRSDGYVDALYDKMFAYFIKVDKKLGKKHTLTLAAMGAPQEHGQRSFRARLSVYDRAYARQLGIDTNIAAPGLDKGRRYNQHWGYLDRATINDPDGIRANGDEDTISAKGRKQFNEKMNYYHKPQFYLKHFWEINKKSILSTTLYASYGNGGGTTAVGIGVDPKTGQFNFQSAWYANTYGNAFFNPVDPSFDSTQKKSTGYIYSNVNNHQWYGILSTLNHRFTKQLNLSVGADLRTYKGIHYREIHDLLGGDYTVIMDTAINQYVVRREGDKYNYYYNGYVQWGGVFAELEYKATRWSSFLSLTGTYSSYQVENLLYNPYKSEVKKYPGFTVKTGLNYNLTERWNAFFNLGYLSRPPRFNNVFDRNYKVITGSKNEQVASFEIGAAYHSKRFTSNINAYLTNWMNKPADFLPSYVDAEGDRYSYNINGMKALHQGIEVDFIYKALRKLDIEGSIGIADWRWKSGDTVRVTDDAGNILPGGKFYFSAKDVHVGDAAQTQMTVQLRYEPIKGLYIKPSVTYFARNYADFDPSALKDRYADKDSWKLPDYTLFNIHAGYGFTSNKVHYVLNASVFNVLDKIYISDAQHRVADSSNPLAAFNPKNVEVFVGPGTTWNLGLKAIF